METFVARREQAKTYPPFDQRVAPGNDSTPECQMRVDCSQLAQIPYTELVTPILQLLCMPSAKDSQLPSFA